MSNEYTDYLYDKVQEVLLNACLVDKITKVRPCRMYNSYIIEGYKNKEKVKFEVWYDEFENEWRHERREL